MVKYLAKVIFLLLPSIITFGLFTFSLLSDTWVSLKINKLNLLEQKYANEFNNFENIQENHESDKIMVKNFNSINTKFYMDKHESKTQNTTSKNIFSLNVSEKDKYQDENENKEYDNNEENENPDSFISDESEINSDDSNDDSYDNEFRSKKSLNENLINVNKVDLVFITQLWPIIVSKSLYHECIQYKKLNLKISSGFLTRPNKAPIIGTVYYGKNLDAVNQCDSKVGKIKCILSQDCVSGKKCDGIVDCDDQSDEQSCFSNVTCNTHNGGFNCDQRCWPHWNKCDKVPNCLDLSDETASECFTKISDSNLISSSSYVSESYMSNKSISLDDEFTLGRYKYDYDKNCFLNYFNFKSAKLIKKENLKHLTQQLADTIQETNNIDYHLQLIYILAFLFALIFCFFALLSLLFICCFRKMCFQCPFWFFGFFIILSFLTASCGLMTYLYQWFSHKQKILDPSCHLPIENELYRLNSELIHIYELGFSFWICVAATAIAFFTSLISCIVCCRLPTARHEDKEYKIMQLPTYS